MTAQFAEPLGDPLRVARLQPEDIEADEAARRVRLDRKNSRRALFQLPDQLHGVELG